MWDNICKILRTTKKVPLTHGIQGVHWGMQLPLGWFLSLRLQLLQWQRSTDWLGSPRVSFIIDIQYQRHRQHKLFGKVSGSWVHEQMVKQGTPKHRYDLPECGEGLCFLWNVHTCATWLQSMNSRMSSSLKLSLQRQYCVIIFLFSPGSSKDTNTLGN